MTSPGGLSSPGTLTGPDADRWVMAVWGHPNADVYAGALMGTFSSSTWNPASLGAAARASAQATEAAAGLAPRPQHARHGSSSSCWPAWRGGCGRGAGPGGRGRAVDEHRPWPRPAPAAGRLESCSLHEPAARGQATTTRPGGWSPRRTGWAWQAADDIWAGSSHPGSAWRSTRRRTRRTRRTRRSQLDSKSTEWDLPRRARRARRPRAHRGGTAESAAAGALAEPFALRALGMSPPATGPAGRPWSRSR